MRGKITIYGAILIGACLALSGCMADLNTTAFRLNKLAADGGVQGVHNFNVYYRTATNGMSAEKVADLDKTRDQVYDASRKLSAVLAVSESARLAYSTNANPTTEASLNAALSAVAANQSSVTGIVANALSPQPVITVTPGFSPIPARSPVTVTNAVLITPTP